MFAPTVDGSLSCGESKVLIDCCYLEISCLDHSLQLFIAYLFFSFSRCGHSSFVVGCFHPCRLCYNNNELQGENSTPRAVSYRLLARSWGQGESTTWRGPRTSMPRAQEPRQPATQSCLWLSAVVLWSSSGQDVDLEGF